MSEKLLNLVSALEEDLPTGGNVEIMSNDTGDYDYIIYGSLLYDDSKDHANSCIELGRVVEHEGEFEVFDVRSFHNKDVYGFRDMPVAKHCVAIRVEE